MSQLQKLGIISARFRYNLNSKTASLISSSISNQFKRSQATSQTIEHNEQHADWERARPFKEIPTFSKLSMFLKFLPGGKYHNLDFDDFLQRIKQEYGNIFLLPGLFGKSPTILLYDPDDFAKIFYTGGPWPIRPAFQIIKHYREELRKDFYQHAQGLPHTQGEEWGTFRSAVNPVLMQPRTIKSYLPKMAKVNWEFIERIKEIRDPVTLEVPENFEEEINRYTLESVSVIALDKELGIVRGNRDNPEVIKLFKDLTSFFRLLYCLEVKPSIWKYIRTPEYHQIVVALDGISNFVVKCVEEAIDRLENQPNDKPNSEKGVLEKLLKINKKLAMVMVIDMLAAGVDTTTTTLTGVLLCLAKNQEKQQQLRDELRQVFPQKDTPFTEDGLKKLPYLRAVIKECLRVYPIGPALNRTTNNDIVLNGYQVPKGVDVTMISFFVKESSKYYVEGNKFLPERWLRQLSNDKSNDVHGSTSSNPFVYLPFGFGPRMCIGRRIVELELEVTVARLVRNFNIEYNYPVEKAFKSHIIYMPAIPLKFKFTDVTT